MNESLNKLLCLLGIRKSNVKKLPRKGNKCKKAKCCVKCISGANCCGKCYKNENTQIICHQ